MAAALDEMQLKLSKLELDNARLRVDLVSLHCNIQHPSALSSGTSKPPSVSKKLNLLLKRIGDAVSLTILQYTWEGHCCEKRVMVVWKGDDKAGMANPVEDIMKP